MPLFQSSQEKRYWLFAALVLIAIFSTLTFGRPFQKMLSDQNVQAAIFLTGMFLTGIVIVMHGLKVQPSKTEIVIWVGLATVYLMLFLRLGVPERSHLIEFGVLAIFIHKALSERFQNKNQVFKPALIAFLVTCLIGFLDEGIQYFLPERVFDTEDIIFNSLAAFMAIGGSLVLRWAKNRFSKNKT